jgi:hypothetical protein
MGGIHPTLEFDIDAFQSIMDKPTFKLFEEWCEKWQEETLPLPLVELEWMLENYSFWSKRNSRINMYRAYSRSVSRHSLYAEMYQILAFTLYGYGNWSNNARKQRGLQLIRFKQLRD